MRNKYIKINKDDFKDLKFNVEVKLTGIKLEDCDCWRCEADTMLFNRSKEIWRNDE